MTIKSDHTKRINKVFEYIDQNLDGDLSLTTMADIACFSPFHFHRIFRAITGETLNEFITRRKIEKSVADLLHRQYNISEIAYQYGFSASSAYTKAFKKFYGMSPTAFKKQPPHPLSKIKPLNSKNGHDYPNLDQYVCTINNLKKWIKMNANIEIKVIPELHYMSINCMGAHLLSDAFQTLISWAAPKGLMTDKTKLMTIYHDSLKITAENQARFSACLIVDRPMPGEGQLLPSKIETGKCIVGHYEIHIDDFEQAWTGLYLWMNENGHQRADKNAFEIYHNNFNEHPQKKAIVDFHIPIV